MKGPADGTLEWHEEAGVGVYFNGPNQVNVEVITDGAGQELYVETTPAPAGGWSFDHWEGDAYGDAVPLLLYPRDPGKSAGEYECNLSAPTHGDGCGENAIVRAVFKKSAHYISFTAHADPHLEYMILDENDGCFRRNVCRRHGAALYWRLRAHFRPSPVAW